MRKWLLIFLLISQASFCSNEFYVFEIAEEDSIHDANVPQSPLKQLSVMLLIEVLLAIF
ncbi:MAG: hypothetical protein SP1CHLAM54_04600 [Chlamydiia bacterium]|nr:hypothetical protein [Chlamydiia bacterium]MCH9615372.1 hypothetical protein [Chlamydiia bacterium]MCH9628306.1 hypothetical protein [Chlamydiia bacterium]